MLTNPCDPGTRGLSRCSRSESTSFLRHASARRITARGRATVKAMRAWRTASIGLVCAALLAGCSDYRAERLVERASDLARRGKYDEAIRLLEDVRSQFPDTAAARGVERQIVVFRGLQDAEQKEKRRRAGEDLILWGRKLDDFRAAKRRFPGSLAELGPRGSATLTDPWGRPYRYEPLRAGARYRLGSLGADGAPGGEGDDQDLLVDTGEFAKGLAWEEQ